VLDHTGTPLPFYPVTSESPLPDAARFAAADELEFQEKDFAAALVSLTSQTKDRNSDGCGLPAIKLFYVTNFTRGLSIRICSPSDQSTNQARNHGASLMITLRVSENMR